MRPIKSLSVDFAQKFWARVFKADDDCWYWQGARDPNDYGRIGIGHQRTFLAHRVAWALVYGDPGEWHVLHKCDNPACVNPDHLFLGTNEDNIEDRVRKGRSVRTNWKLSPEQVVQIRELRRSGLSYNQIGANFGIAHTTARRICLEITWKRLQAA
jgi:hypothetical protein